MKIDITNRFYALISQPERLLRMTLFTLLYAFMNVAIKLTIADRIALNPGYTLFLSVGMLFAVLFSIGIFVQYYQNKNAKATYKKYNIQVIN